MKVTLTTSKAIGRLFQDEYAGWSYAGAKALVEYLEQYEEETGEEIELDVIALRCDYSEYESALDAAEQYGFERDKSADEDVNESDALEYLNERTVVIPFESRHGTSGVIIQQF